MTATPVSGGGTDQTNTLDAEAKSGAGGSKVGLAGSLALNIADTSSQALIKSGAQRGRGRRGCVADARKTAPRRRARHCRPMAAGRVGGKVGIGASVAVNVVANRSTGGDPGHRATDRGAGNVTRAGERREFDDDDADRGGLAGRHLDHAVGGDFAGRTTPPRRRSARSATGLTLSGDLLVQADQTSSDERRRRKGSSQGAKAAIGAAVAVALVDDEVTATTARTITPAGRYRQCELPRARGFGEQRLRHGECGRRQHGRQRGDDGSGDRQGEGRRLASTTR